MQVNNLRNNIAKRFFINTNHELKNTILLAGTGRSGTTWVSNIINFNNEYRDIFEPFSSLYSKEWRAFNYKQYLRPDDKRESFLKAARNILTGKIKNKWVDQFNQRLICQKRIVKDIRINFLLKWINHNFNDIPIIFLIRHPCAVALSRMKLKWKTHLQTILEQEKLVNDFFMDHVETLKGYDSEFDKQIALWCIENYVPLSQFENNEIYIMFYEKICMDPDKEFSLMFKWLGKQYHKEKITLIQKKPSAVSKKHSAILNNENLITKWVDFVSKEQVLKAVQILERFGLDRLYGESPYPET